MGVGRGRCRSAVLPAAAAPTPAGWAAVPASGRGMGYTVALRTTAAQQSSTSAKAARCRYGSMAKEVFMRRVSAKVRSSGNSGLRRAERVDNAHEQAPPATRAVPAATAGSPHGLYEQLYAARSTRQQL